MLKFIFLKPIKFVPVAFITALLLGLGLLLFPARPARAQGPVINLPDLPPGKVITITFRAGITTSLAAGVTQVCNQGTITGTNFAPIVTNDPTTPAANDATCTPIDLPTATLAAGAAPSEAGPTNGSFSLSLDNPAPAGGLTLNYTLTGSTAANPADYSLVTGTNVANLTASSVTIAAGQTNATLILVTVDDSIDDDGETVRLNLAAGSGYTLGATTVATQTILDNDTRNVTLLQSGGSTSVTEGGSTDTYTIQLDTIPTATVTISFNTGSQINAITNLTFPADVTALNPQPVTVTAIDDTTSEGDHSQSISHSASGGGYTGVSITSVTANIADNDIAYTLTANNPTVNPEGNIGTTPISFTLTRTGDITRSSTVDFSLSGSATNGADYNNVLPGGGVVSFGAGVTRTTVTLDVLGDFIDEANETITVTLSNPGGTNVSGTGLISGSASAGTTIIDDDSPSVVVTPTTLTLSEPNGSGTFNIRLTSQPTATVTIGLSTGSDECTFPASVNLTTLNWAAGVTVTVTATDDTISDGPQSCLIVTAPTSSSDPVYNNTFNPGDVSVTVNDDELRGVSVSPTSVSVAEGGATSAYTVRLNTIPTATVTINFNTGSQINAIASLTFLADVTALNPQTVTVTALDDATSEGNHSQVISHNASGGGYTGETIQNITANINDNDIAYTLAANQASVTEGDIGSTPIAFTLTRTGDITRSSTVDFALGGTAANGVDYSNVAPAGGAVSFGAGVTQTQVTLDILGDFLDEVNEAVTINLSNAQGTNPSGTATLSGSPASTTITDDDSAGVSLITSTLTLTEPNITAVFTLALTSQPTASVTLNLASTDTTECTVPASVSLDSSNWDTGVAVTVAAQDDFITDGLQPCIIQTGPLTSADPAYNGTFNPPDVSFTVADDDVPGFTLTPPTSFTTTETGGTASFSVRLRTQPTATVTLSLTSSDTTEGTAGPALLIFTTLDWNIPQTVTVTGANDDVDDGDRPYTIITNNPSSGDGDYNGAGANPVDVDLVNLDDDSAGFLVSSISGETTEDGITATFTIRLTSQPTANVTVPISSTDATECTVSPASLSFTAFDWNVPQTVTVTGVDDPDQDGDINYAIQVGLTASGDPLYDNQALGDVAVTNQDNDGPPISPSGPIYLPIITKNAISASDLVIDSLNASSSEVTVVLRNGGNTAITDAFWVDIYFNPSQTPSLNKPWPTIASRGLVWGVQGAGLPLDPGESLTLTLGDAFYFPQFSSTLPLPVGATVFGLVDSVDFSTSFGVVQEGNEANNLVGPILSTAGSSSSAGQSTAPAPEGLPDRE